MSISIISVGNGGFNVAKDIIDAGIFQDVQLIVCDTDPKDLERNSANGDEKNLLPRLGRAKVQSRLLNLVDEVVEKTHETVIICATLGGQTGSKYAPLIWLNALSRNKFVCSVVSMPFDFESGRRELALRTSSQIIKASTLVILQYNERLKTVEELDFGDMNKPLVETLRAISQISLKEVAGRTLDDAQKIIPSAYATNDQTNPLIWIRTDTYSGFPPEERIAIFG